MFAVIFYGGIALALLMLWFIYRCARSNGVFARSVQGVGWKRWYRWRYLLAFLVVPIAFVGYPIVVDGDRFTIFGFPLMVAAFDSKGADFVGPFTDIFVLFNVIILYFSIHIFLCLFQRCFKRRKKDGATQ